MAKDKKSVLLYCDLIHTIEKMDNETAGKFFKHYLRYINDLNPKTEDLLVDISFESVKQNLKRDLKKWEVRAERSRENGKLGGRPSKEKEPIKPSGLINNPTEPRKPDTVTVNVTDTVTVKDTVNVINIIEKKEIDNLEVEFTEGNNQLTIIDEIEERKIVPLKKEKFNFRKEMLLLGFEEDLVVDWLAVRKTKKATNTLTSLKSFCKQVGKTGLPINEVLKLCIEKDWKGFNHEWLNNLKNNNGNKNISSTEQHSKRMQNSNNGVDEFLSSQQ